jgi:hypothetical protein
MNARSSDWQQEGMAEIDVVQSRLHPLILDIDAIEATFRVFGPGLDLALVKVWPTQRRSAMVDHADRRSLVMC